MCDQKNIFHKKSVSWETRTCNCITSYFVGNKPEDIVNKLTGDVGTDGDRTIDNLFTSYPLAISVSEKKISCFVSFTEQERDPYGI